MELYWHRRNLRPAPNPALSAALSAANENESGVVPLFVLDDAILSRADGLGVAFMLGSLRTLRHWYRDRGSDLAIQRGDPTEVVSRVARRLDADRVVWNSDHSRLARGRDRAVQRALTRAGVAYTSVSSDQPTEVESTSKSVWEPETRLANPNALGIETGAVPRLSELSEHGYDSAPLTVNTESASKRLHALSNGTTYRRCDEGSSTKRDDQSLSWA